MLSPGDVIGDWLVEDVLGEGSMGVVYRCRDQEHRAIAAAVKVARPTLPLAALRRFRHEVLLLKQLRHDAIIQFYSEGIDSHHGLHWFAMELLEGMTLRERLAHGSMPVGHALALFTQISAGLAAAHSRRIFHRDLKPSNLFLGQEGSARILDFGAGLGTDVASMTASGHELGTYAYMPPEVFRGQKVDPAQGDVYGTGLVLYEVLLGREIYLHPLPRMTTLKIQAGPLDPGPHYPRALRELIMAATHPEPHLRLSDMDALAERIAALSAEHAPPRTPIFPTGITAPAPLDDDAVAGRSAPLLSASTLSGGWWVGNRPAPLSRSEIVELLLSGQITDTTRIARPGSVWRELRYHPNFRSFFTPGSEANAQLEALRRAHAPSPEPRRWLAPVMLLGALLIGGLGLVWPEPTSVPSGTTASDIRAETLLSRLEAEHAEPGGDPAALLSSGLSALSTHTDAGARSALTMLSVAAQLSASPQVTAALAETAAQLSTTEPAHVDLARLTLMVAADQGATDTMLAPARMALALAVGNTERAIETALYCEVPVRCAAMLAEARRDLAALAALESAHPEVPGLALVRLRVLIARQDWLAVRELADALTARFPDEALPHYGLARAAAALGDQADFELAIERATLRAPGWLALRHLHARQLLLQGRSDLAREMLRSVTADPGFAHLPDGVTVWRDLAVAAQLSGDASQEAMATAKACALAPDAPQAWIQRAWALSRAGDAAGARKALEAVDLSDVSAGERTHLGLVMARVLVSVGAPDEARVVLRAAAEEAPGTAVWTALSGVALSQGETAAAVEALSQAALYDALQEPALNPIDALWAPDVTLQPTVEALQAALVDEPAGSQDAAVGIAAWLSGDVRTAEPLLRRAPRTAATHSALGQLLLSTGRHAEAADALGASVRLSPGRPEVVAMYSFAMAASGERTAADRLSDLYTTPSPGTVYWKARALLQLGAVEQARSMLIAQISTGGLSQASWLLLAGL